MSGTDGARADGSVAVLVVRRIIRADPHRLFTAWTTPAHLTRWWGPGPVTCPTAEVDLRVGGRYRLANLMPDGRVQWITGTFETVDPPRALTFSWQLDGEGATLERVTVRFEPRGPATEVIIRHERIPTAQARISHEEGWRGCLDGLDAYLSQM